jgi:hypothetical protein
VPPGETTRFRCLRPEARKPQVLTWFVQHQPASLSTCVARRPGLPGKVRFESCDDPSAAGKSAGHSARSTLRLVGPRFEQFRTGRLTVLQLAKKAGGQRYWKCRCDCGGTKVAPTNHLFQGRVKSCGCLSVRSHGGYRSRLYRIWADMKARCRRPTHQKYPRYGLLGIGYDPAWEHFADFQRWAKESGYKPGLHLARRSKSGDYRPANCWWSPRWQLAKRDPP